MDQNIDAVPSAAPNVGYIPDALFAGAPETPAVRRTDYDQPRSGLSEQARARPWLVTASGITGAQSSYAGYRGTSVEGGLGAQMPYFYQGAGIGAYNVGVDSMDLDSPGAKEITHMPARTYGELTMQQVSDGNSYLTNGAQKTPFTEYTSRDHASHGGYGDPLGPRGITSAYAAGHMETSPDSGPDPEYSHPAADHGGAGSMRIGMPLIVAGVAAILLMG